MKRCKWPGSDPLYQRYHDREWGVPVHGDRRLFEFLVLEGAQAGLSWITVLRKRPAYREAFDRFDFNKVARYDERKVAQLLDNPGIILRYRKLQDGSPWMHRIGSPSPASTHAIRNPFGRSK